jgi:hypothetical protein
MPQIKGVKQVMLRIWIRVTLGNRIRIRISLKSCIRIRVKVMSWELWRFIKEPWRLTMDRVE